MTSHSLALSERVETGVWSERLAFWASVALILTFSQCWVMLLTGPPTIAPIDPQKSSAIRNFYFPAYLVTLILAASRPMQTAKAILRAPALAILVGLAFVSMLWSIDPDVTMRRSIAVLFTTLTGVVIAARFPWPRFLEVLASAFAIVVVMCFAFALFLPSYGKMAVEFPGAWRGVWDHKNTLGFNMSIGCMVFAAAAVANPGRRWLWTGAAIAALGLLLLSTSKTSVVSCLIGAACIGMVVLARRGTGGAIAATVLGVAVLAGVAVILAFDADLVLGWLGKDATLTGRTKIWAGVLRQIHLRPVTGYGYGAVWDDTSIWGPLAQISKDQGFVIHEAHNSWLGVWLELGYIGLAGWGLLFVGVWIRTALAVYRAPWAYFALPFLAVFTLHTFTETVVLVQNDWVWLIFAALAAKLAISTRPQDADAGPAPDYSAAPASPGAFVRPA